MKKRLLGVAVIAASALAAVSFALGGTTTLKLTGDKTKIAYSKKTRKAHTGKITIAMKNPSSIFKHDVAIKINGKVHKGKTVGHNGVSKLTLTLKPGTYTFYCTVPGHAAAGMKGKLVVSK